MHEKACTVVGPSLQIVVQAGAQSLVEIDTRPRPGDETLLFVDTDEPQSAQALPHIVVVAVVASFDRAHPHRSPTEPVHAW